MRCPNCNGENNDSAKFCKKCGTPLKKGINHENMINTLNNKSNNNDDTTKYIIVALIIVAIVLAGAFIYIYGFSSNQNADSLTPPVINMDDDEDTIQSQSSSASQATPQTTSMSILGGSFTTGDDLDDKTYASIYVGSEHAGEKVTVQIFYSRDGSALNNGNMVPVTVKSNGYIEVSSADAYKYFPDFAEINLFDDSGNLLDSQSVSLKTQAGTQTF